LLAEIFGQVFSLGCQSAEPIAQSIFRFIDGNNNAFWVIQNTINGVVSSLKIVVYWCTYLCQPGHPYELIK
jgi:hypothetical protein